MGPAEILKELGPLACPDMGKAEEPYRRRTPRSAKLDEESRGLTAGGTSHNLRRFAPYPFYTARARGSRLWDVDGNEYVDLWMGHYALILGHAHPVVVEALQRQAEEGNLWGTASELEVQLARLIHALVPCAERVRFSTTGSEATMYAVRLARGYAGGNRVLKIEGGWHGFNSDLLVATGGPFKDPESLGLLPEVLRNVGTMPFNDLGTCLKKIETTPELAAVIVEPFLGAGNFIPGDRDYVAGLREACDDKGCLLVFDEIISGFRLGLGGAQEYYGVTPDLATFGKIMGGGLPASCVAGRADIMDLASPDKLKSGKGVAIGGGTYSCNAMALRAGLVTLEHLKGYPEVYENLDAMGSAARKGVAEALEAAGVQAETTGVGSLFQTHLLRRQARLRSARDVWEATDAAAEEEFRLGLINEGYYTMHGGGAFSAAHSPEEAEGLISAVTRAARAMKG